MSEVYLAGLNKESVVDGPGIRAVLYFQGCPHRCPGCHNPETWPEKQGLKTTPQGAVELIEKAVTPLHSGVTFSGGEPFLQAEALREIAASLKKEHPSWSLWCYTGYLWEEIASSDVLEYIDVVVDGTFRQEELDLTPSFRGSSNQRIIAVRESLEKGCPVVIDR